MEKIIKLSELQIEQSLELVTKRIILLSEKKVEVAAEYNSLVKTESDYVSKQNELYRSVDIDFYMIEILNEQISIKQNKLQKIKIHLKLIDKEIEQELKVKEKCIIELNVLDNARNKIQELTKKEQIKKYNKSIDQIVNDQLKSVL